MGIVRTDDARKLAYEADLDLVEVAPKAKPPVAKIMDYGKFKYEQAQKAREARKNQQQTVVKEQKFRPKIDDHDYETKKGNVVRFLAPLVTTEAQISEALRMLDQARYPLANAMLYKIYAEPFLLPRADIPKAETYRQAYAELPVARSGYPSFERARQVVDRLLAPTSS